MSFIGGWDWEDIRLPEPPRPPLMAEDYGRGYRIPASIFPDVYGAKGIKDILSMMDGFAR